MKRVLARAALVGLCALLLLPHTAGAVDPNRTPTQYVHRIWQMQQGLPQASIYAIVQGADGYLWLGTQAGLVRFDGVRFTTMTDGPLGKAWVDALVLDQHRNLWVATRGQGVFQIRPGAITQYSRPQGLPTDTSRSLLVARDGAVWSASGNSVARIARGRITAFGPAQGMAVAGVNAMCQAADGTIWIGGHGPRVSVWNGAGFASFDLASVPSSTIIQALLAAGDGSLWIGTSDGLVHVQAGRERLLTTMDGLADNSVLTIVETREGGVWAGTKNGFSRVRGADIESFRTEDGLSQSTVYAICEDREGSIWVGTKHGLNQFLDGRTVPYTTKEGLPSNETGPVLQAPGGEVWVGTLDAGLGRFDGHRFVALTARNGLSSNTVRALAEDGRGSLWVGTDAGLDRLRNGRVEARVTTRQGLPANGIRSLFVDHAGALWAGTVAGVAMLRDGAVVPSPLSRRLPRVPVAAITEDAAGRILVALPSRGVYALTRNGPAGPGIVEITTQSGLPIADVDALYEDRDGFVWMGTVGNGLWLVGRKTVVSYSMQDGLFDDEIYGIASDANGRLWMACSKGVFSVARSDLLEFAARTVRRFVSTPYSPTEALRTIECRSGVQPAVWRMQDGRLWFSTIRGLIVIDPAHLEHHLPPTPVVVEDIIVDGRREAPGAVGHLRPGRKNLEFNYTAPSFVAPARITFRYVLEGFDRDWVDAGTRRAAFYTNLPPGTFRFRVRARNVDGTWAETAAPIVFTIAPFVYQRGWFFPLVAALLALTAWLLYRLRVRRLRAHFAIVLAERNRIARELHDTLIQGLAGITMEMQALVARLHGRAERSALEDIIRDAGTTLRDARRSLAGLRSVHPSGSGLAAAVAQTAQQLTAGKDIRLKLRVEDELPHLPAEVAYNVLRIAQEAIANAVVHSGASSVEVRLERTPRGVELVVADAGEGIEGDEATYVQLGHYGLTGMRERARDIGAEFSLTSEPGRGTSVRLVVPVEREGEPLFEGKESA